jgi:hypothetical protein
VSIATLTTPNGPYHKADGSVNAGGRVLLLIPGTSTKKNIWLDEALSIPAANPIELGIDGRAHDQVFLEVGDYDVQEWALIDPAIVAPIFPADYGTVGGKYSIAGLPNPSVASTTLPVAGTMADLRALQPTVATSIVLTGYYAAGDKPARTYTYDPMAVGDNAGTIITPNYYVSGAWVMHPDTVVDVRDFGAIPGMVATCNTQIGLAQSYADSVGLATFFFPGSYNVLGGGSLSPKILALPEDAMFNIVSGGTFTLSPTHSFEIGIGQHDGTVAGTNLLDLDLRNCPQVIAGGCDPLWFWHNGRSTADNFANAMVKSGASGLGLWRGYNIGTPLAAPLSASCRRVVPQTGGYVSFSNAPGEIDFTFDQVDVVGYTANTFRQSQNATLTFSCPIKASWFTATGLPDCLTVNANVLILDTSIIMDADATISFLDTFTGTVTHGAFALTYSLLYTTPRTWYL